LTNLLLDDLEKTRGRVVSVGSSMHRHLSRFDFDNVMAEKSYALFHTYSQSKLANVLFIAELQRRLHANKSSVKAFSLHPGCIQTNISHNMHPVVVFLNKMAHPILSFMLKNPEQGARCTIHCATAPDKDLLSAVIRQQIQQRTQDESKPAEADVPVLGGQYFAHCVPVECSKAAKNEEDAKKLWQISEKLTGLGQRK
jgi:NAD(P)-dependent dehydrogenase (short-subunit alcohol dehydrogenase family)